MRRQPKQTRPKDLSVNEWKNRHQTKEPIENKIEKLILKYNV